MLAEVSSCWRFEEKCDLMRMVPADCADIAPFWVPLGTRAQLVLRKSAKVEAAGLADEVVGEWQVKFVDFGFGACAAGTEDLPMLRR